MANSLYKHIGKELRPDNNLEAIRAYIIADGQVIKLTEEQERQKMIIDFTDEQIRSKQGLLNRYAIASVISNRFDITIRSAQKYITLAEDLYSSSNPLNKKYKIQLRIEFCEKMAEICVQKDDLKAAAAYEKCIQEYIKLYPEVKISRSKRVTQYVLPGQLQENTITVIEAEEILNSDTVPEFSNDVNSEIEDEQ